MKFRPCIDIHEGIVKQIVGSTLAESQDNDQLIENFRASKSSGEYARMYKEDSLFGGHVILLGPNCENACLEALREFPNGLQIGGGVNIDNALRYLNEGASHVIITSYVFIDGHIDYSRLTKLVELIGKEHLVLDISCRKNPSDPDSTGLYYVVTNKWTKFTDFALTPENIALLADMCDEFLVHGVDVEGKKCGIEEELVALLGKYCPIPVTYAGGIRSIEDMELVQRLGNNKVDCTIGSALDIFGGDLEYRDVVRWHKAQH